MSKRRHNFGTKRFKEKSLFIFHARIALKSLILLFVHLIARGARIGKTHRQTHRHTDRTSTVTLAHARRGLITGIDTIYAYVIYLKSDKNCLFNYNYPLSIITQFAVTTFTQVYLSRYAY